jgi:predicted ATPase
VAGAGAFFGSIFGKKTREVKQANAEEEMGSGLTKPICQGLYLFGGTGCGKTMLMDLFYEHVEVQKKKRVHFHGWMLSVHHKLHALSKTASEGDLVDKVANEMMHEAHFMCFDEFQVTFISDAVIMRRLFTKLFAKGFVMVATSNRPPRDLYLNGLNRELFTPFIPVLENFCLVHNIDSSTDYRMLAAAEADERAVYLTPSSDEKVKRLFEAKFYRLSQNKTTTDVSLEIQGRTLDVTRAAVNSNIAWFSFGQLCNRPLGAADYIALAKRFHTIFIEDIPKLTLQERDQMRRFITLIDALYDHRVRLVCTAADTPLKLFVLSDQEKKISSVMDEVFAWDRLVSRLTEMQSQEYLAAHAQRISASQMFSQYELDKLHEQTDIEDLWTRFDIDGNGHIDRSELKAMLQDLFEHAFGHRNVPTEVFDIALKKMDIDADGVIGKKEFFTYVRENGLLASKFRS